MHTGNVKTTSCLFLLLLIAVGSSSAQVAPLEIGSTRPAIDARLVDISNTEISLDELVGQQGLLVVFICNTCPWVRKWEGRFNGLADLADSMDVGIVFLNPNEALRNGAESLEAMKTRAQESSYSFSYAADSNHLVADAFGATRTPEAFLFDANNTLVYRGAIDDNARHADQVEQHFLIDAMHRMVSGADIAVTVQKAIGCTIKRVHND